MADTALVLDRTRSNIAIGVIEPDMIADRVMPEVPETTETFTYLSFAEAELLQLPDTEVGSRSEPQRVSFGSSEKVAKTKDHALMVDATPTEVREAAGIDDLLDARTEFATRLLLRRREKTVADLVFSSQNYLPANVTALSGSSQWSDPAAKPLQMLRAQADRLTVPCNTLVLGLAAWNALTANPSVVKAAGNTSGEGFVSVQKVAELLEVGQILIGKGFANLAKPGQPADIQRLWGKHAALLYIEPQVTKGSFCWGTTHKFGKRKTWIGFDQRPGAAGIHLVKVAEQRVELVVAPQAGALFQQVVP
ncbi:MAG: hypothetical protein EAZ99_03975 [Alphaproteobacteria bacterium]|nr:MAG: hypothetical protein EAZ99_03975 [Alphaproteobacteria bacterium]